MSAALPPLKPAPGGARGRRPSPCQVRGTSKNVAQQRQPTTNVSAGQTQHRGCDQGLRERRTRPYKWEFICGAKPQYLKKGTQPQKTPVGSVSSSSTMMSIGWRGSRSEYWCHLPLLSPA